MNVIEKILTGAGALIAVYLVLNNGGSAKGLVGSLSGAFNTGVTALQGR